MNRTIISLEKYRFTSAAAFLLFRSEFKIGTCSYTIEKIQVPFSIAIETGELVQERFPNHLRMGTARRKQDKETDEVGKNGGVSMERSKAGRKKEVPIAYHYSIKIQ